jgi:DNA replication and repair protein RecF
MSAAPNPFYIAKLHLLQFKNYAHTQLTLGSGVHLISGKNGAGKTNLLDAIYYLCCCKSYFQASDAANIQHETNFFRLDGTFCLQQTDQDNGNEKITVKCSPRKKEISRNGSVYERLSEHVGLLPLVIITPDDTELIKGSSEERRKLIDLNLSQLDHPYLQALIRYNKLIQQRNALLKQFAELNYFDASLLDTYDAQLIAPAQLLHQKRQALTQAISPFLQHYYALLSNGSEAVSCTYKSELNQNHFADILKQQQYKDRDAQRTTQGLHRDDWTFEMDGYPLKKFGSQGQQKSFLIALKLALYRLLHQQKGISPLLLLDDVFDKLDPQRIAQLSQIITTPPFGQVLMTDTQSERMAQTLQNLHINYTLIKVQNGEIVV